MGSGLDEASYWISWLQLHLQLLKNKDFHTMQTDWSLAFCFLAESSVQLCWFPLASVRVLSPLLFTLNSVTRNCNELILSWTELTAHGCRYIAAAQITQKTLSSIVSSITSPSN
jgi:hypothetical protein